MNPKDRYAMMVPVGYDEWAKEAYDVGQSLVVRKWSSPYFFHLVTASYI